MYEGKAHFHWQIVAGRATDKGIVPAGMARLISPNESLAIEKAKTMLPGRSVYQVNESLECYNPNCTKEFQDEIVANYRKNAEKLRQPWEKEE